MNDTYISEYLKIISQQVNMDVDMSKVLTMEEFLKIKQINTQIAYKRTSRRIDTSFFVQLAESRPVILLATQEPKYVLPTRCTGQFHGVQLTPDPWIPVISLFLIANERLYSDVTPKGNPVTNVHPLIYTPIYETDQFQTFGRNKESCFANNAYITTGWIPTKRDCTKAKMILSDAYKQYGDIFILVNDNGNLVSKSLKQLWMIPDSFVKSKTYENALQNRDAYSSSLIKDYGRYGFRESKISNLKKKLIMEKKKLLSK